MLCAKNRGKHPGYLLSLKTAGGTCWSPNFQKKLSGVGVRWVQSWHVDWTPKTGSSPTTRRLIGLEPSQQWCGGVFTNAQLHLAWLCSRVHPTRYSVPFLSTPPHRSELGAHSQRTNYSPHKTCHADLTDINWRFLNFGLSVQKMPPRQV